MGTAMPRPEKPIDPSSPLADFAAGLRELRYERGITYREMAGMTNFCVTVLSVAAGGQYLPTWEVTLAYIAVCGGPEDEWRDRWNQARETLHSGNGRDHA